jgi:hypothetical protein
VSADTKTKNGESKVVDETVSMDGTRVVETHADGTTTQREPTLAETVGAYLEDIERTVRGMVPSATASAASSSGDGDSGATVTIALGRDEATVPDLPSEAAGKKPSGGR